MNFTLKKEKGFHKFNREFDVYTNEEWIDYFGISEKEMYEIINWYLVKTDLKEIKEKLKIFKMKDEENVLNEIKNPYKKENYEMYEEVENNYWEPEYIFTIEFSKEVRLNFFESSEEYSEFEVFLNEKFFYYRIS